MPYININEIDNTQYGLAETNNDNIVYCPINAICGTYEPTLITSYDDLIKVYGNIGCTGDPSFTYVKELILAGFPVLCKRIRYDDDNIKAGCAITSFTEVTIGHNAFNFRAKYHGTYMNDALIEIKTTKKNEKYILILTLTKNGAILDSASISEDNIENVKDKLINTEFNYITVNYPTENDPGIVLSEEYFLENEIKSHSKELYNGLDLSNEDNAVSESIIAAYGFYDSTNPTETAKYEDYLGFLNDKYMWEVKFITMGGYTHTLETGQTSITDDKAFRGMIYLCESRQDCFAILDLPYGISPENVKIQFSNLDTTYAAAYAPWTYDKLFDGTKKWMPPSHAFLTNLAQSTKSTPIYYPPAGVNRMHCRRTIKTEYEIGAKILNVWQSNESQCINPIMRIRGTGYTVYGQRTLVNLISPVLATSLKSVTVRFCSIEIKKAIFNACVNLTFEQNILRTWNEFKSKVETKLLGMKKDGALNSYQILMDRSTISNTDLNNNIARGIVRCAINDAIENFEIGFEISPSYVNFDEEQDTLDVTNSSGDSLN